MSRPSLAWCEAAQVDGPTPQSAIHRALQILALQGSSAILAPGALDAAASAVIGFCDTVLTRARGGDSQLLRDIAAVDRRVDCLRDVCQARYDALRDAGELPAVSDRTFRVKNQHAFGQWTHASIWSGEGPVDSDSDASDDFSENEASEDEASERADLYDGLTGVAVLDALSYLRVTVCYADDVESGDESEDDGDVESDVDIDLPATGTSGLFCHLFDSRCPDCGRACLVTCIDVTLDGVVVRQRPVASLEELETIEKLPHFYSPALDLDSAPLGYDGGPCRPYEFATIGTDKLAPWMRAAAREAGVRRVASSTTSRVVGEDEDLDLYKTWMEELVVLAQAARDATEVAPAPIRYVHDALQAIIKVLDLSPRRLHPISLQTADLDQTASYDEIVRRTLGVSTRPDVLAGPQNIEMERGVDSIVNYYQGGNGSVEVDDEANELFSLFLSRRLATLFSRALCAPRFVLCPFTGNGATVDMPSLKFVGRMNPDTAWIC
jgi:hypothetical protein